MNLPPASSRGLLLILALLILTSSPLLAKIVFVRTTGSDSNNGSSWALAKGTVQAGLNASVSGDEVWVAAGTYVQRITLKAGVGLYGGFFGDEMLRGQRNWKAYITVLDGNQAGSVVTSPSGAGASTRIDGFTIRNGSSSGIYCSSSSPTITNNVITGNSASYGGGMYCSNYSSPTITNNVITGNSASYGGGIYSGNSSPTITNNSITANAASYGGGINCASDARVSNNIVAFNSSGIYGAAVLRNNDVYGNGAYNYLGLSAGTGDISADPVFVSREYGDLHIQAGAPCVNAGWNGAPGLPVTDMEDQPRVQGGTVDIGADESDGMTWPPTVPQVVMVSPTGDDANDGSSWESAKRTVQAGINAAAALGGEVWVESGTYGERITLPSYVYLYGGFIGSEAARSERNWSANATVLDGGGSGSVVTAKCGYLLSAIDGFTIRNGSALTYGGGIYCTSYSSPTIANSTIAGNAAPQGGGIYSGNSSPTITNNTITGNTASSGGGIYSGNSSPTITNNTITGNTASSGGGVYCLSASPTITNNTITGNTASSGGGIHSGTSSATITNNTITGNTASSGGGIYCYSTAVVSNNIVAFNSSGMYNVGTAAPVLRNNDLYANPVYNYSGLSAGSGDISADPILVCRDYGDLHIEAGSPCVNAGWNSAAGLPATDMDGQARVQGGTVDIGADESDGTTWPPTVPRIVRVSPTGDDADDGSSWESAKRTVQAGINNGAVLGAEVWVKSGTYNERITLLPYAYVYGGFAGSETAKSQRNWSANATVLDGGDSGSVVTAKCGYLLSAIDGFTIRNGSNSGIYCSYSSPMIANNAITGNGTLSYGGGIYCSYSLPTVTNNVITGNTASQGGGIYCNYSSPTIRNNTVTGNSATNGGAAYCYHSSPTITNNTITGNSAGTGGAVSGYSYSSPTVSNNIVAFNSSGLYSDFTSSVLRNNDVYGNLAYNYSGLSAGTGDVSADPLFASKEYGDLHIQAGSPCVNAGWNGAPGLPPTDMDGQARVQGATVDIGADESDGTTWPPSVPRIVRVSSTGDDANDGSSWGSAKKTVQAGIDAAAAFGGQVWVEAGTYGERITVPYYAYIYGGFVGTETARSQRNWSVNVTILDGGQGGPVVTARCGHLLGAIDGFVIRNGSDSGIYCSYSSPTITNDSITGNSGGGIYCSYSFPTITDSAITGNSGSGVYCYYSSPTIANDTIIGNTSSYGGGMHCESSSPAISNNIVAFNSSGVYGSGGTPVLHNNDVYGNTGYNYSGLSAGTGDISADPLFANGVAGDYRLTIGSQCINTGDNSAPGLPVTDMDGHPRVYDGTVDIGAYEFSSALQFRGQVSITPGTGSYDYVPSALLTCDTPGAVIHYTKTGVDPTGNDPIVTEPVLVDRTMTLKARAWLPGWVPSTVASASYQIIPLSVIKGQPNNSTVTIPQAVVTAVESASLFYVEADDRSCGILVAKGSHGLTPGKRVSIQGATQTLSWGEKYVSASSVTDAGTGTIRPLALNNRDVGGGDWRYNSSTKTGQKGVKDFAGGHPDISTYSSALNNIGMLITTTGQVTYSTTGYFYIDDGYGLADNSGHIGIKVMGAVSPPDPLPPGWTAVGHYVSVTGISSCFKVAAPGTDLYRQIWCSQVTLVQ